MKSGLKLRCWQTITVVCSQAPDILNPGGSTTISETETGEVALKTLNIQEFDADDATCTLVDNDGGPFSLSSMFYLFIIREWLIHTFVKT